MIIPLTSFYNRVLSTVDINLELFAKVVFIPLINTVILSKMHFCICFVSHNTYN